jgi:hypothetical protein
VEKAKRQKYLFDGIFSLGRTLVESKEQYMDVPVKKTVSKVELNVDVAESLVMDRHR